MSKKKPRGRTSDITNIKSEVEGMAKSGMINFYELHDVQSFMPTYHNPTYNIDTQPIKHPCMGVCIGATGAGKTNIVCNIIKVVDETFNKIYVFTANKTEPLYQYLEHKLPKDHLEIHEGLDFLNALDLDKIKEGQVLMIFDDLVLENNQDKIEQLYIRGRKLSQSQGISFLYLSQSFYNIPSMILKQMNLCILRKLAGKRDINNILREMSLSADKEQLLNMFNYSATADISTFLLIDLKANDDKRFRKGLTEILNPADFIFPKQII